MSGDKDYYKKLLVQDYNPNPVFAEISTGNWVLALMIAIESEFGSNSEEWKSRLVPKFPKIQGKKDFPGIPMAMRALSQGMTLTMSLEGRAEAKFYPWDTVGLISDFYYCITNLFDVIIIGQTGSRPQTHASRINQFDGLKSHLAHPFDMFTCFNENLWNGSQLITKEHFTSHFPGKGIARDAASESSINKWHNDITVDLSNDILLGYLRGTTGFYWEEKCEEYKIKNGLKDFKTKEARQGINPALRNGNVNFLDCLYRYRTKAHYRDFIYLTNSCFEKTIHKANDYIDGKFTNSLFGISYFSTCLVIRYLEARLGRKEAYSALDAIRTSLKSYKNDLWDIYN